MVPRPEALGRAELHHRTPFEGLVIPAVQTEITLLGAFALEISGLSNRPKTERKTSSDAG